MSFKGIVLATLCSLAPALSLASVVKCSVTENNQGSQKEPVVTYGAFNSKGMAKFGLGVMLDNSVSVIALRSSSGTRLVAIDAQHANGSAASTEGQSSANLKLRSSGTGFEIQCAIEE